MRINPKQFGLSARTELASINETTIAIVIRRQSRIIMADGKKILASVQKIQQANPSITVVLKISSPICSKTAVMLRDHGIKCIIAAPGE